MMYGQMTAGSWIYIGSQGIVQGTYETFVEMGRQHFGGDLSGKWILTAGLGGMGGAQPLAATMAGASMLAIECQRSRIEKRLETRYLDRRRDQLDEALALIAQSVKRRSRVSVGLARQRRARSCPNSCAAASSPTPSPTRPARTIPSTAICPKAGRRGMGSQARRAIPPPSPPPRANPSPSMSRAMLDFREAGHSDLRLRQQHPPGREGRGRRRTRSTSRASCRPISARCSAAASARSAGRRCPAIRRTSTRPTRR